MRSLGVLSILIISIIGCAVLNQPTYEITSSQLTCETNPEFVDGNLETSSAFSVRGHLEKRYQTFYEGNAAFGASQRKYMTQMEGTRRTAAVIKLDSPTYVSYVEIYPASRIPKIALMTTLEEPPKFETSFDVVRDKLHTTLESTQPVRFHINREILYLRLAADGIEDRQNAVREILPEKVKHQKQPQQKLKDKDARIRVPLTGASIREVKFYGQ